MDHNAFQRELIKHNIDPRNAYLFTLIYERLTDVVQQLDQTTRLIDEMSTALTGFVELSAQTQQEIMKLKRRGMPDGIDVHSVGNEPEG